MFKNLIMFFILMLFCACSTNKKTRWLNYSLSGSICYGVGAANAKKDENPEFYGAATAAPCLLVAGIVNELYFSDDKKIEELKKENQRLNELRKFKLIKEGVGYFENEKKQKKTMYKITGGERWVEKGNDTRVKEVMEVKKIPSKTDKEKEKKNEK